jgi:hypothetical protein
VILVIEIETSRKPRAFAYFEVLLLVAQDVLGGRAAAAFLVVGGADEVACVALANQLGAQAAGVVRHVVEVGVDGGEDFTLVGLPRLVALHHDLADVGTGESDAGQSMAEFHGFAPHRGTAFRSTYSRRLSR